VRFLAALWAIVAIAAPIVVRHLSTKSTPAEINIALGPWAVAAALVYVVFALYAARAANRGQKMASVLAIGFASLIALQIVNGGYQVFAPLKSAKTIASEALPWIDAGTQLFVIRSYDQTLPFYLRRTLMPVEFIDELELGEKAEPQLYGGSIAQFRERWMAAPKAVAFTSPDTLKELQASGLAMKVIAVHDRHAAFAKPQEKP
jgi:hypothetical protein